VKRREGGTMRGDLGGDLFQKDLVENSVIFAVVLPLNAILAEALTASLNKL